MTIDTYALFYFPYIASLWFFAHKITTNHYLSVFELERFIGLMSKDVPFRAEQQFWKAKILELPERYPQFFEGDFRIGIHLINDGEFYKYYTELVKENRLNPQFAVNENTHHYFRINATIYAMDILKYRSRKHKMHIPVKEFIDIMLWEKDTSRLVELHSFLWAIHLCNEQTTGSGMVALNPEGYYVTTDYSAFTIRKAASRTGYELYTPTSLRKIACPMDFVVCTRDRTPDSADLYDEESEQYQFIVRMCRWLIAEFDSDQKLYDQTMFDNLHKLGFTDEEMKKS